MLLVVKVMPWRDEGDDDGGGGDDDDDDDDSGGGYILSTDQHQRNKSCFDVQYWPKCTWENCQRIFNFQVSLFPHIN